MKDISNQHSPNRTLILPLILLLVITLSSILAIVIYSVVQVNKDTQKSSEEYVAAIINDKLSQYSTLAKDYAFWDEAIEKAYLTQDKKWIDENIGKYLTETFKVSDLFIINEHDKAVLFLKEGIPDKSNYQSIDKKALKNLLTKARQSAPEPVAVSGIIMINNTPAIVGASIFVSEDRPALPQPQPVLVIAIRLEPAKLAELSSQYRLKNLQYHSNKLIKPGKASFKLFNPINKDLGILSWQPDKPGSLMLSKIKYPLLFLLLGLGFITFIIIRATLATSQQLNDAYKEMTHLANHDMLTGLPNRRLFSELLGQTIHAAKRDNISSAMLFLDLDGFKKVNDTFGHHEGDSLLVTVAARLKDCIREADTVARIGGDEFTILLRKTSSHSDIISTVQKIQTYLETPIKLSKNEASITVSVGITLIPQDGTDPDTLMKNADIALYECKEQGRNTYRFYKPDN